MSIYRVKIAELTPYLQLAEISENQSLESDAFCGHKIRTVQEGVSTKMQTFAHDEERIELCSIRNALFDDLAAEGSGVSLNDIEQMENKPPSPFDRCKKFAREHPYLATTAAVAFPVVCGLIAYGVVTTQAANAENRMLSEAGTKSPSPTPKTTIPPLTIAQPTKPSQTAKTTKAITTTATPNATRTTATTKAPTTTSATSASTATGTATSTPTTTKTRTSATTEPPTTASTTSASTATGTATSTPTTTKTRTSATTKAPTTASTTSASTATGTTTSIPATTKTRTSATTEAPTVASTTPLPMLSVSVEIDKVGEKFVRVVTRREVKPDTTTCFNTTNFIDDGVAFSSVTNNCERPILIAPIKNGTNDLDGRSYLRTVAQGEHKTCHGSETTEFRYYQGVKVTYVAPDQEQELQARVEGEDIIVGLPLPPGRLRCLIQNGNKYTNKCTEGLSVAVTTKGEDGKQVTTIIRSRKSMNIPQDQEFVGADVNVPDIKQTASFEIPYQASTTPMAVATAASATTDISTTTLATTDTLTTTLATTNTPTTTLAMTDIPTTTLATTDTSATTLATTDTSATTLATNYLSATTLATTDTSTKTLATTDTLTTTLATTDTTATTLATTDTSTTTLATTEALTTTLTTTLPMFIVSIEKEKDKESVVSVVTRKKVTPETMGCFTATKFTMDGASFCSVTNNCERPILIAPMKNGTTDLDGRSYVCTVEQGEHKTCHGSETTEFLYYQGVKVTYVAPDQVQEIQASVQGEDIIVGLPLPPGKLRCLRQNGNKYTNECTEVTSVAVTTKGKDGKQVTTIVRSRKSMNIPKDQEYVGADVNVPDVKQRVSVKI